MRNPRYANAEGGILLDYDQDGMPSLYVTQDCPDADLWHAAVGGQFGPLAAWVPPSPQAVAAELAARIRMERDQRLAASDWTQLPDVPDATAAAWAPYRQALRDITKQPTFPQSVTWPEAP